MHRGRCTANCRMHTASVIGELADTRGVCQPFKRTQSHAVGIARSRTNRSLITVFTVRPRCGCARARLTNGLYYCARAAVSALQSESRVGFARASPVVVIAVPPSCAS